MERERGECDACHSRATGHDARADVWALGLIALEVATRRIPFHHVKEVVLTSNLGRPEAVNPPLFLPDDCPGMHTRYFLNCFTSFHRMHSSYARACWTVD